MSAPFVVEPLAGQERAGFNSGVEPLDRYLRAQAGQDMRRRISTCFLAMDCEIRRPVGFYTLAMSAVMLSDLPEPTAKRLPRYPHVPAARLGRLAVDRRHHGRGLGAALLWDAIKRTRRTEIAAYALLVDAKDDRAVEFYRHHGFIHLPSAERVLFLPLASVG